MQSRKLGIITALLGCSAFIALCLNAQSIDNAAKNDLEPAIITGQAFSAIKYTRTVHIQPDGRRTITAEGHHVRLARDAEGRVFMADAGMTGKPCDLPSLGKLPLCDYWESFLFDPEARLMWHWSEGEIGDKTQLSLMNLREDQMAEAEQLTSVLDKPTDNASEPGVNVQNLGERNFEGVRATGVRTTTMHAGADGKPAPTIHEVWTSMKMRLVLRVIEGNPLGEETVSGLNHISLAPDLSFFKPPEGRTLRHWKDNSKYAAEDITNLSEWLIK